MPIWKAVPGNTENRDSRIVNRMKNYIVLKEIIAGIAAAALLMSGCGMQQIRQENEYKEALQESEEAAEVKEYGVFLGINREDISCLEKYDTVVIEPSEFMKEDIEALHQTEKTVYAYLNAGSIEEYRPYYQEFESLTLDVYDSWPDERWVDVSSELWQEFLISRLGGEIADMGFDGFFIDNCDVYAEYETDSFFEGLCNILDGLKQYDLSLLINGGDVFVSRAIDEGLAKDLMDGVNQETVFTGIDFDAGSYSRQTEEETKYFTDYLEKVRTEGLEVYLLEYRADEELAEEIEAYCTENGFHWYNASSLELDA